MLTTNIQSSDAVPTTGDSRAPSKGPVLVLVGLLTAMLAVLVGTLSVLSGGRWVAFGLPLSLAGFGAAYVVQLRAFVLMAASTGREASSVQAAGHPVRDRNRVPTVALGA